MGLGILAAILSRKTTREFIGSNGKHYKSMKIKTKHGSETIIEEVTP